MGTLFQITAYTDSPHLLGKAFARARQLDQILSDYKPDSELNQLCRAQQAIASPELFTVLQAALKIAAQSRGAFDPTVGPLVRQWREARRTGILTPPQLDAVGWGKVKLNARTREVRLATPEMQLDLGGIAKGYAADEMLAVLKTLGIPSALVAASGDLAIGDPPPGSAGWRVRVANEVLTLANCAVSTSGDSEQFIEIRGVRYSHIMDPRTGLGVAGHPAVTVIAPKGIFADALATALNVLGEKEGRKLTKKWQNLRSFWQPIQSAN
jgi:thiamine biosynthesis lipoprotein